MAPACDEWIVVKVENPARVVGIRAKKHGRLHHRPRSNVVAEGLEFEPTVLEQQADVGTNRDVVRIDIEATFYLQVAKPEVVGLHCRMIATFKGALVPPTQRTTDESLGSVLVE